jgi:lysophospholipase L1-like esterase
MMNLSRRQAIAGGLACVTGTVTSVAAAQETGQVVLVGDSIFDNQRYVNAGQATIDKVRTALPAGWSATLLAKDGTVVAEVGKQLPQGLQGKYVFVSAGGNDGLRAAGILNQPVSNSSQVFKGLADIREAFFKNYCEMVKTVVALGGNTTLSTIYNPNYPDQNRQRMAETALCVFNDCITRTAFMFGLPVLDLRSAFTAPGQYANEIEPSADGGRLIAEIMAKVVKQHDFRNGGTRLYA